MHIWYIPDANDALRKVKHGFWLWSSSHLRAFWKVLKASAHRLWQSAEHCAPNILFHYFQYNPEHQRQLHRHSRLIGLYCRSCLTKSIDDSTGLYAVFAACSALKLNSTALQFRRSRCVDAFSAVMCLLVKGCQVFLNGTFELIHHWVFNLSIFNLFQSCLGFHWIVNTINCVFPLSSHLLLVRVFSGDVKLNPFQVESVWFGLVVWSVLLSWIYLRL